MRILHALSIVAGTAFAAASPALAASTLGQLTCNSEGGIGYLIGSSKNVVCEFRPANAAQPAESYAGTLDNVGLDIGITGRTTMQWTVLATGGDYAPSSLGGSYVGASADASLGLGGGAKVLTGGDNGLTLQPISVQGQEGVNAAVGVAKFTLEPLQSIPATTTVVVPAQ